MSGYSESMKDHEPSGRMHPEIADTTAVSAEEVGKAVPFAKTLLTLLLSRTILVNRLLLNTEVTLGRLVIVTLTVVPFKLGIPSTGGYRMSTYAPGAPAARDLIVIRYWNVSPTSTPHVREGGSTGGASSRKAAIMILIVTRTDRIGNALLISRFLHA